MNPTAIVKKYWSILKRCLNDKKILCKSPLFHCDKFITGFKEKAEHLNSFFQSNVLQSTMAVSFPLIWFIILTKNYLILCLIETMLVK